MMESNCDPDAPECWCPCGCGCQNDPNGGDLPFDEKGLCASCSEGRHEVPPLPLGSVTVDDLIAAHESILKQLRKVRDDQRVLGALEEVAKSLEELYPDEGAVLHVRALMLMHERAMFLDKAKR